MSSDIFTGIKLGIFSTTVYVQFLVLAIREHLPLQTPIDSIPQRLCSLQFSPTSERDGREGRDTNTIFTATCLVKHAIPQ